MEAPWQAGYWRAVNPVLTAYWFQELSGRRPEAEDKGGPPRPSLCSGGGVDTETRALFAREIEARFGAERRYLFMAVYELQLRRLGLVVQDRGS